MRGVLIADAGSTKTNWSLLFGGNEEPLRFQFEGINPLHEVKDSIYAKLKEVKASLPLIRIDKIIFYGAGCASKEINDEISDALKDIMKCSDVAVNSDMIGAAVSLFGKNKGIACILGTGSNSCIINKGEIIARIPSLGFILGDEGGGVSLGKALLGAVFKRQLSDEFVEEFHKEFKLTVPLLIQKVYQSPKPAPFLASFSPFLLKHIDRPEVYALVEEEFDRFFIRNIIPYGEYSTLPVGIVGSVAYNFREIIMKSAKKHGISVSTIIADPMPSLEIYHSQQ